MRSVGLKVLKNKLSEYVRLYETIGSAVHPTKVIGISLNTYDMSDEAARQACEAATRERLQRGL